MYVSSLSEAEFYLLLRDFLLVIQSRPRAYETFISEARNKIQVAQDEMFDSSKSQKGNIEKVKQVLVALKVFHFQFFFGPFFSFFLDISFMHFSSSWLEWIWIV